MPTFNFSGFQAVFENLPQQGRAALPFLGVLGDNAWDAHALSAISQLPYNDVEISLRQLERVGFVTRVADERYQCSPVGREFALSRLRDMGGEPLVRQARSVMAYQALRAALDITTFGRQSLLRDYLKDATQKKRFLKALGETFQLDELDWSTETPASSRPRPDWVIWMSFRMLSRNRPYRKRSTCTTGRNGSTPHCARSRRATWSLRCAGRSTRRTGAWRGALLP